MQLTCWNSTSYPCEETQRAGNPGDNPERNRSVPSATRSDRTEGSMNVVRERYRGLIVQTVERGYCDVFDGEDMINLRPIPRTAVQDYCDRHISKQVTDSLSQLGRMV